jgi:OOP family OmpA-OmpF porin
VSDRYSWEPGSGESTYRASNQDHLGWWAAAAMLASILLHVVVFFALDQWKFALDIQPVDTKTERVSILNPTEVIPEDRFTITPPPEDFVAPPPADSAKLLDDVDLLDAVKDLDVDMAPQVVETTVAILPSNPAASGSPTATAPSVSPVIDMADDLPELGRSETEMKPAAVGQVTVDPGSVKTDTDFSEFTDDVMKRGANGKAEKGSLEGVTSLEEMIGLPANQLLGKKTMLPSDLLFEFNKSELRESAKVGLFKLGSLLDNNPTMYCWIEGHTDLIGSDAANLELSIRRAEAVKNYLVKSMYFDPDKIITRGYGRFQPIITTGDKDQQAPNRRVEIKMRRTPPTEEQMKIVPPKAAVVAEERPPAPPTPVPAPPAAPMEEPAPPKAQLVRPSPDRVRMLEERVVRPQTPNPEPAAPKAMPVEQAPPAPPRAKPVEPEMPATPPPVRAVPVDENESNILKAQPVTE